MRKVISIVLSAALFLFLPQAVAASPKAGSTCKSVNKVQKQGSTTFVCVKSGKKLLWKIKPSSSTAQTANNYFDSITPSSYICKPDKLAPKAWNQFQSYNLTLNNGCDLNFYRYSPFELTEYKGSASLTDRNQLLPVQSCKIPKNNNGPMLGFSRMQSQLTPYSKATFQVIPIETLDYKTLSTPTKDYGHYFDLLESWVNNNSDNGSSFKIRVPEKYVPLNKSLSQYQNINVHNYPTPEGEAFLKDVAAAADPSIDFSGSDLFIVVVPPQVNQQLLGTNPWGTSVSTQEGNFWRFFTITPFNYSQRGANSGFIGPQLLLHEMHHAYFDFGDHGEGMGGWGLMSLPSVTDLLGWDKFLAGFYSDQQVRCLPASQTLSLLVPNVAKSTKEKLAVIPVGGSKVLILESVRVGGFNYKLPKSSEGVLVYEIQIDESDYHKGVYVVSTDRGWSSDSKLAAPLRPNESIISNGYKITVVESGSFGDVVKVEKL